VTNVLGWFLPFNKKVKFVIYYYFLLKWYFTIVTGL